MIQHVTKSEIMMLTHILSPKNVMIRIAPFEWRIVTIDTYNQATALITFQKTVDKHSWQTSTPLRGLSVNVDAFIPETENMQ